MTSMSMRGTGDEIAQLRAHIEKLEQRMQAESPAQHRAKSAWRRPLALVSIAVLTIGMLAGVAGASGSSTTNVTFVSLSPAKPILSAAIGAHKTSSPVVIGGATTVPADATTVELVVTAKGASVGTLEFYPAKNTAGGSGQTLPYPGSNVVASTTIQENVGQSGQLTILNDGIGSAAVTAKIIGYSTQVTAGDINGVGGTTGQVLTNTGAGAAWTDPGGPSSSYFNSSYQSLPASGPVTVGTLYLPQGYYQLSATMTLFNGPYAYCSLVTPSNGVDYAYGNAPGLVTTPSGTATVLNASLALQGLVYSPGETVSVNCGDVSGGHGGDVYNTSIIATRVNSATGSVSFSSRTKPTAPAPQPAR